jgi:hypothetical protein
VAVTITNTRAAITALNQAIKAAQKAEEKLEGGDPKAIANIRATWQRADMALRLIDLPPEDKPEVEVVADEAEPSEAD